MYLTGHVLANGATLSNNPQLAVQEFHMWMAKKGLFELLEEDRGAFEATLQVAPMLLQDLFPHDGMDAAGEQTGQILPGATISLEDVQAVHRGSI
jgi:hypothetical protein